MQLGRLASFLSAALVVTTLGACTDEDPASPPPDTTSQPQPDPQPQPQPTPPKSDPRPTGDVTVSVVDYETGRPAVGVKVLYHSPEGDLRGQTVTGRDGSVV